MFFFKKLKDFLNDGLESLDIFAQQINQILDKLESLHAEIQHLRDEIKKKE